MSCIDDKDGYASKESQPDTAFHNEFYKPCLQRANQTFIMIGTSVTRMTRNARVPYPYRVILGLFVDSK